MKSLFLGLLFASSAVFANGNGGDVVNNGGGLSEQAIMFSAQHYSSFIESCLRYDSCGAKEPLSSYLKKVRICPLPKTSSLRFGIATETPELSSGRPYVVLASGHFVINREKLYSPTQEALRIPEALGYLSRIYFDHCGVLKFDESFDIARLITAFTNNDGEQVTIGKDSIKIPAKDWVRIRTLYSDLIIEGPKNLLRLSCPLGSLNACTLLEVAESQTKSHFKNLSLSQESITQGLLSFEVQGSFIGENRPREYFKLSASYQDGNVLEIKLQGQNLELPSL
ncbi:MAG: hypothetical protein ACXVB1_04170 [Pseudobdellovibrionaceae bacterium]